MFQGGISPSLEAGKITTTETLAKSFSSLPNTQKYRLRPITST
jgi:hypothetical protein